MDLHTTFISDAHKGSVVPLFTVSFADLSHSENVTLGGCEGHVGVAERM